MSHQPPIDDDEARRRTAGHVERLSQTSVLGVRMPAPLKKQEAFPQPAKQAERLQFADDADERTPLEPIEARRRGVAPPLPDAPPPSLGTLRPANWDETTEATRAAEQLGYTVQRERDAIAAAPAPPPVAAPLSVARPASPWLTEGLVKTFFASLGAFVASTLTALGVYRATAPPPVPPPPATDIACPPFADQSAPRGALCMRVNQLESALGTLQAREQARTAREDREKTMLEQEPPKLKK